ncbi:hypothetical protein [Shewanella algae]|uniref:hypothetical protein n=1 Tax=Shewanella algae TaxID=38313 RepID=UPI003005C818
MATQTSITPALALVHEANAVIKTLTLSHPAGRDCVESALESLEQVASQIAPTVARDIHIRLIALRNRLHVHQLNNPEA